MSDAILGTVGFAELKRIWFLLSGNLQLPKDAWRIIQEIQSSTLNPLNNFSVSNVNVATRHWIAQAGIQLKRFMGQKQNSFTPFEIGSRQRSEENTQALGHELNGFF